MRLSGPHGPLAALGMTSLVQGVISLVLAFLRPRHPDRPVRLAFRRPRADRLAAGSRPQPPRDAGRHRGGAAGPDRQLGRGLAPVGYGTPAGAPPPFGSKSRIVRPTRRRRRYGLGGSE